MPMAEPLRIRPRRLRSTSGIRRLVQETVLTPGDLIAPIFVCEGSDREVIPSMPGVERLPVADVAAEAAKLAAAGVGAVILFGVPLLRDATGSQSHASDGVVQRAVRAIREADTGLPVITDVCLCGYTDHGHCGVIGDDGLPMNDATLEILGRIAVSHAEAGADIVAPSGMMDGMVGSLREALDDTGHTNTAIMSYSVKYASAFYGPFRKAVTSGPQVGDRRTHQMDPANASEALLESDLDVAEGADFLMVKPAIAYLDVIRELHLRHPAHPLVAYHVSGEYSMLKAAVERGWLDERSTVLETLTAVRRAGAAAIITYYAGAAACWLGESRP